MRVMCRFISGFLVFTMTLMLVVLVVFVVMLGGASRATGVMGPFFPRL